VRIGQGVVHILSEVEDVHWVLRVSEEAFPCIQIISIIIISIVVNVFMIIMKCTIFCR
jgi:hypothetical protein